MHKQISILFLILMMLTLSCGSSGPSDSQIESAIKISLEKFVPIKLVGNLLGGKEANIKDFKIIDIGDIKGKGSNQYWPVKIYAKGTCKVAFIGRKSFEGEAVYKVSQDDFGKWIANNAGIWGE